MSASAAVLGEVAEINPRFDRSAFADLSEPASFVPMAQVSEESGSITQAEFRPIGELLKGFTPFADRDVLVAKITPCFENGKIAHARISKRAGFGSTEFHVVRPDAKRIDDRYLFHFLRQPRVRVEGEKRMTGSGGQRRVPKAFLEELTVPLPPLAEQRRIATILDKADALRAKRREAIAKLDQLLQSVFLDMFGDPAANTKGWPKASLDELVIVDAQLVDPREPAYENLLHFGPDRISKESGRLMEAMTAKEDGLISKKFLCDNRHVLYSKIRPYLNKVALVEQQCLCSADVYPVEPKQERLSRRFLWHILRSKSFLDHAAAFSNRANIPKINREQLLQYECIVPPLDKQQQFERISKGVESLRERAEAALVRAGRLFSVVQQRAFPGVV